MPTYPKHCFVGIILELGEKETVAQTTKLLGYGDSSRFADPQEVKELVRLLVGRGTLTIGGAVASPGGRGLYVTRGSRCIVVRF